MSKEKFMELVELAINLNHPRDFQVSIDIKGFGVLSELDENGWPIFRLCVSKECDFENQRVFQTDDYYSLCRLNETTVINAIEWLKGLHEEMMIQESRK